MRKKAPVAPFSQALLLGMLIKPLPKSLWQPLLKLAMERMQQKHPNLFERLEDVNDPTFIIDAIDLPFCFYMRVDTHAPELTAIERGIYTPAAATIKGTLKALLALLQGDMDGDAAFFSREIIIEGKTETIVALRNATDSENIDVLKDLLSFLPNMGGMQDIAIAMAKKTIRTGNAIVETIGDSIISPAIKHSDYQAQRIESLESEIAELKKILVKNTRPPIRKRSDGISTTDD